jgi:hypothetical protein
MAHYAFLDENNIVTEVIVGRDENDFVEGVSDWEGYYAQVRGQRCLRTSYNNNIRGNFATIGSIYDELLDIFIPEKPFPSWVLKESKLGWQAPIVYPTDGKDYIWVENDLVWKVVSL